MATAATAPRGGGCGSPLTERAGSASRAGIGREKRDAGPQLLIFQCHALAKTPYLKLAEPAGAAAPTPAFAANRQSAKKTKKNSTKKNVARAARVGGGAAVIRRGARQPRAKG